MNTLKHPTAAKQTEPRGFAEVIESSLHSFLAQCWVWDDFPVYGSLVMVESGDMLLLGTVSELSTGSMDPMRYPFPYKKTEEELKAEQPQIFEFLKTTFRVHIVGYQEKTGGKVNYLLPPKPAKIHSFVRECDAGLAKRFFSQPDYVHLLFAFESQTGSLDELLLAILKHLKNAQLLDDKALDAFCKTFSLRTGNDYRRLKLFLQRVQSI